MRKQILLAGATALMLTLACASALLGMVAANIPARAQAMPAPDALQAARELISLTG